MLTIWGRPTSLNSIKVFWCLDEIGIDYAVELYGLGYRSLDEPEFLAVNPNRMVPVLGDDGFILWESHAIVRYLAAVYGAGTLCPADPKTRALADMWMDWMVQNIKYRLRAVFHTRYRPGSAAADPVAAEKGLAEIAAWWAILDDHLKTNDYVAGADFTMGDIPLGCALHRYREMVPDRPEMPALEAWFARLAERPAYRKHAMQPLA
jgi:glutathione S-transferase